MNNELKSLLAASAVRKRCRLIGELAGENRAEWFFVDWAKFENCVDLVATDCLINYPDLEVPYHSRWRHFTIGDIDLWDHYVKQNLAGQSATEIAKCAIDLVFISVLLDAGAGADWRYHDPVSTRVLQRSEGLAAASINMFFNDLVKNDKSVLTASDLKRINAEAFRSRFQVNTSNPLVGVDGRLQLLHNLAIQLESSNGLRLDRPGDLIDHFTDHVSGDELQASKILEVVLSGFNAMWPSGLQVSGVCLGDCGRHSQLKFEDETSNLIPFHKLSQWLSYSLIEPLQWAGFKVIDLDALTGLPEYRNGGLLLDCGLIKPRNPNLLQKQLEVTSEPVVEWRALTVYLLDKVADGVREKLVKTAEELPLASILQGGTWSAGRKLAYEKRNGTPPINLAIDGTIF